MHISVVDSDTNCWTVPIKMKAHCLLGDQIWHMYIYLFVLAVIYMSLQLKYDKKCSIVLFCFGFIIHPFISLAEVGVKVVHALKNPQSQKVLRSQRTILAAMMRMISQALVSLLGMEVIMEVALRYLTNFLCWDFIFVFQITPFFSLLFSFMCSILFIVWLYVMLTSCIWLVSLPNSISFWEWWSFIKALAVCVVFCSHY